MKMANYPVIFFKDTCISSWTLTSVKTVKWLQCNEFENFVNIWLHNSYILTGFYSVLTIICMMNRLNFQLFCEEYDKPTCTPKTTGNQA